MRHLLIGSTRAGSGKSATVLGLAFHLQSRGFEVGYGKPIGTFLSRDLPDVAESEEADVSFITQTLGLSASALRPTLLQLDRHILQRRLLGVDTTDYGALLRRYHDHHHGDVTLVEAPANTAEGSLFGLSLSEMADCLDAPILLVARFNSLLTVEHLLVAQKRLGDRLMGVVINDIPSAEYDQTVPLLRQCLLSRGIAVFGLMPDNRILRSVSVSELVEQLEAKVMYASDLVSLDDLMVEELKIGAMDVNSALSFFRRSYNKAVVTGSDRLDLQLAALETSTSCLILTGQPFIADEVQQRARELGVPILFVGRDTLATVSTITNCLGQVRLHEGVKVQCIREMMAMHFDFEELLSNLGLVLVK
ncbi:MAG: phosphotransacetylase family protein [Oscillatoriales cyanobacterium SM2_2_1]|nr:phosphotransacetylase family protein [Oscillatoriales cyanobacterium SM2_2_1]